VCVLKVDCYVSEKRSLVSYIYDPASMADQSLVITGSTFKTGSWWLWIHSMKQ